MRDKIQEEISKLIISNNFKGILYLPTGVGKSKIIIDALKNNPTNDILWVCASEKARDVTIKEELKKWGLSDLCEQVTTICWQSLPKYKKKHTMIILDELQMITPNRAAYVHKHYPEYLIAVTGTKPKNFEKLFLIDSLNVPVIQEKSVEQAVKQQLIADYEIEIYYTRLDQDIKRKISTKKGAEFYATEQESYNWYTHKIETSNELLTRKKMALNRARLLYMSESKKEFSKKILKKYQGKRTISFSKSILIAEQLSRNCYHSKMKKEERRNQILRFNNKEFEHLATVEALNTSENLTDIDIIYIHQLDGNPANYLQRQGRGLRLRQGYVAKIVIICIQDTVDEVWTNNCISSLNPKKITKFYELN